MLEAPSASMRAPAAGGRRLRGAPYDVPRLQRRSPVRQSAFLPRRHRLQSPREAPAPDEPAARRALEEARRRANVPEEAGGVTSNLTLRDAARIMREATKDKSYRAFPLGGEAGSYLRWKRGSLTESSYRDYESCLDKLARHFVDLELADFAPPVGTERLEKFLDDQWGSAAGRTYNKNHSILTDFFEWAFLKGELHGNPVRAIPKRKKRDVLRETFSQDVEQAIMAMAEDRRDRLALRLLFKYGLRKGALQHVQFKHFDHQPPPPHDLHEGADGARAPDRGF
jgi:hypothetical protein